MWFKVVLTDIMTGSNSFGCKVNSAHLIGNPLHSGNKNIIDEPLQPPGENTRLYQGSRTPTAQVMTWNWKVIRCQINHGNRNFMWLLVKEEVLPRRGKKLSLRGKRHRKLQRQQLTIGTQCNFGGASLIKDTLHSKKKKCFLYVPEFQTSEIWCVTHTKVLQNPALIFNEQFTCKDLWLVSCRRCSDVSNSTEGK